MVGVSGLLRRLSASEPRPSVPGSCPSVKSCSRSKTRLYVGGSTSEYLFLLLRSLKSSGVIRRSCDGVWCGFAEWNTYSARCANKKEQQFERLGAPSGFTYHRTFRSSRQGKKTSRLGVRQWYLAPK
jgi:hypothetical protein